MHIQQLTLTDTTITATIEHNGTEVIYNIDRIPFENWLTDGTGTITLEDITATLDEYWAELEINDTPHKEHVSAFLRHPMGKGERLRIIKAAAMDNLMSYLNMDGLDALKEYNKAYHEYMEYYTA